MRHRPLDMTARWGEWAKRIGRWYLLHLLIFGIAGPALGAAILTLSPFSIGETAVLFSLFVGAILFLGLTVFLVRRRLVERRRPKSP